MLKNSKFSASVLLFAMSIFGWAFRGASVNINSQYDQVPGCVPNAGVKWVNGWFEPEIADQAQQELKQMGFDSIVEARSYGEIDHCGTYTHQGVDFTVTFSQKELSVQLNHQGIINDVLSVLTPLGQPSLGNVMLIDAFGEVIPVDTYDTPMINGIQAFEAELLPADAITKKVYVIVYDPLLGNGQKLSEYKNWHDHTVLTQQTIDFFKQASSNKLNYTVVDTTIVTSGWPEFTDGFSYTEAQYLAVLADPQLAHSPNVVDYNKILDTAEFDICDKVNRGDIDEVWIYNGPEFGFYESTLAGPGAYFLNSLPVSGAHGCNRLIPIMGPSVERPVSEAIHNFTHRTEDTMKKVYGGWLQNNTGHNWNKFALVKTLSPDYTYSGCGSSHYPPNSAAEFDYDNASGLSSNCADFLNYPTLGDPLQVSLPVTCSAWGCTTLGYYTYWFEHFPSSAGCGADSVATDWWKYIASPALALYPSNACLSDMHIISGTVGAGGADLTYMDGVQKTVPSDAYGNYFLMVSDQWSGVVTPVKDGGYTIVPAASTYTDVQSDLYNQNYTMLFDQPEINIKGNSLTIFDEDGFPDTSDDTDFGSVAVSSGTASHTFTIYNSGGANLNLTDSPRVRISGAHAGDFSVTVQPSSQLTPGSSTVFTVVFDPVAAGTRTASISIVNDDGNENPYNFSIQGLGNIYPEMDVKGNGVSISNGDIAPSLTDFTNFGSVAVVNGTGSSTFTIYNVGGGALNLIDSPVSVTIGGTHAEDFSVTAQPSSPIAISGSETFTVVFNPAAAGVRTAFISISNDDANENPYTFSIQGTGGVFPEMDVRGNATSIANGDPTPSLSDYTDFSGAFVSSGTVSRTFTIYNNGDADLILTGSPDRVLVSGINSSDFTVTEQPESPIAPGELTTFIVAFDPSAAGLRNASLSIANNDSDENPYGFSIRGTGVGPEINIKGNSLSIFDGDNTPSANDDTDFGSLAVSNESVSHTFTIYNTGNNALSLSGSPKVTIGGANAVDFSVTVQPASSTINPSASAIFTVVFDPGADGLRTASISIANNDADENPYTFSIQGTGDGAPEMDVQGNNISISDGDGAPSLADHTDFGSQVTVVGALSHTFTIYNTGSQNLMLNGLSDKVLVSGIHASDFTIVEQPSNSIIIPAGSETFTVLFDPSAGGVRTASISIENDDANENPYTFAIQGVGVEEDPRVLSIQRANSNPTFTNNVDYAVVFSESVTGVDISDFSLTTTGVSDVTLSGLSGSGSFYTVHVHTGSGSGFIRLDVLSDNSIKDTALNPMGVSFTDGETYSVRPVTFADVSASYWAWQNIERLYHAGITGGCSNSPLSYCPDTTVTRAQMAVFLLKGMHGASYTPPVVGGSTGFADVPVSYWAAAWIKQLAAEGITSGCGAGIYCPEVTVTRAQMAVFLMKAKYGSGFIPPAVGTSTGFGDVAIDYWAGAFIKQLVADAITSGCGGGNYCPDSDVTRAQMAVFLVKTFNLP